MYGFSEHLSSQAAHLAVVVEDALVSAFVLHVVAFIGELPWAVGAVVHRQTHTRYLQHNGRITNGEL